MATKPREGEAEVVEVRWLTPDVIEVDLRVTKPEAWRFAR